MKRRLVLGIALIAAATAIYFVAMEHFSFAWLVEREFELRERIHSYPGTALAIGLVIYTALSLVPGTTGKSVVCGWLFGFWWGLVLVNVGFTAAAVISMMTVRFLFQPWVRRRFGIFTRHMNQALAKEGVSYLLTLRLLHAPYSLTNYAVGTTIVRLRTFWWTTQLGVLPGNVAMVLAGSQLPSLGELAEHSKWEFINFPLLIGLTALGLVPVAIRWLVRRWMPPGALKREI